MVWLSLPVPEKNQFMCDCFYFHCHAGHCDATDDPVFYEWLLYFSKPHPEWSFLCAHSDMHSVLVCKHATINWYWDTQKSTVIFKIKQGITNSIPENSCVILHENRKCFDSWLTLKIKRTHTHTHLKATVTLLLLPFVLKEPHDLGSGPSKLIQTWRLHAYFRVLITPLKKRGFQCCQLHGCNRATGPSPLHHYCCL